MLNDPEPPDRRHPLAEPRKRHPLEDAPPPPPAPRPEPPRPRVQLQFNGVRPLVMWALIAINLAVFLAQLIVPGWDQELFSIGVQRGYEVLVLGQYYRLLTAMFLHLDPAHIFLNMYALFLFGRNLERMFGHSRFAIIYFLGGLAGSVLSVILSDPSPRFGIPSLGASGAVFAIFAAQMVFLYRNRPVLGQRAQQQLRSLALLMAINIVLGLASQFSQSGVRIDIWGHAGGFIGGVLLTLAIGPVFTITENPEQPRGLIATDNNPLRRNLSWVSVYGIGLIVILAYFTIQVR